MLLEQLQANQGKKIVIELVSGRKISGTVLTVNQQFVRMETDEGVGTIPISAIHVVWEALSRSLTRENMEHVAEQLRDSVKAEIACTSYPGFTCAQRYICRPPDTCTFSFSCPGSYVPGGGGGSQCNMPGGFSCVSMQFYGIVAPPEGGGFYPGQLGEEDMKAEIACTAYPGFNCAQNYICRPPDNCSFSFACPGSYLPGFPSGGGGCPTFGCGPFQFGQPCRPRFGCGPFEFGQPCRPRFGCGPFEFGQPCRPRFGCGPFEFGQPCRPRFGCGPFQFGGSQCGTPGGFSCVGTQFFGIVGPPGSQCGTPGGFTCPGFQFAGTPIKPKEAPLPPTEFSMDQAGQNKDNKE